VREVIDGKDIASIVDERGHRRLQIAGGERDPKRAVVREQRGAVAVPDDDEPPAFAHGFRIRTRTPATMAAAHSGKAIARPGGGISLRIAPDFNAAVPALLIGWLLGSARKPKSRPGAPFALFCALAGDFVFRRRTAYATYDTVFQLGEEGVDSAHQRGRFGGLHLVVLSVLTTAGERVKTRSLKGIGLVAWFA
jgi:hypothetical protein